MKKYKYYSILKKEYVETDNETEAKNSSYWSQKSWYKSVPVIGKLKAEYKWVRKAIPETLDLSNTDTFHTYGNQRKASKVWS